MEGYNLTAFVDNGSLILMNDHEFYISIDLATSKMRLMNNSTTLVDYGKSIPSEINFNDDNTATLNAVSFALMSHELSGMMDEYKNTFKNGLGMSGVVPFHFTPCRLTSHQLSLSYTPVFNICINPHSRDLGNAANIEYEITSQEYIAKFTMRRNASFKFAYNDETLKSCNLKGEIVVKSILSRDSVLILDIHNDNILVSGRFNDDLLTDNDRHLNTLMVILSFVIPQFNLMVAKSCISMP